MQFDPYIELKYQEEKLFSILIHNQGQDDRILPLAFENEEEFPTQHRLF
jgi:hypothetical protein